MDINICNLFSGSKGNATYIGTETEGILIDCGKPTQKVVDALHSIGINPRQIKAIFVTHSHSDHIGYKGKSLKAMIEAFKLPLISAKPTIDEIDQVDVTRPLTMRHGVYLCENEKNKFENFEIETIEVYHDVACQGIAITLPNKIKVGYLTDVAKIEEDIYETFEGCEYMIIESNYDPQMLAESDRSDELKFRISNGEDGHISNEQCADFCVRLCSTGTQHFMLAHLSEECNTPALAKEMFLNKMKEAGFTEDIDFTLDICQQENITICNTNELPIKELTNRNEPSNE